MNVDLALAPTLDTGTCPHLAVLLGTADELFPTLASFYALGATRNGLLVHRSVREAAEGDRAKLFAAGLDAPSLERDGRLRIVEFDPDEPPDTSPEPWCRVLDEALTDGFAALWYSRFAIGPDNEEYRRLVPFEQAWERTFTGRPVVTLCPYIVGELSATAALDRLCSVSQTHEGVLIAGSDELTLMRPTETVH
jgi:hypothetical protein